MGTASSGKRPAKERDARDYGLKCDKYVEMVTQGLSAADACRIAGVSHDTIQRWREDDEEFGQRCFEARAAFKLIHISNIAKAGKTWWAASAWLLERTFPEEYAQRSTVSLQGSVTGEMVKRLNAGRERAAAAAKVREVVTTSVQ